MTASDEEYMARAIALARVPERTSPNPRVGAVLVREGVVLGEGFHRGPGSAHAEAVALQGAPAPGGCLYVTLEPCNHTGNTPPCAPAIAAAGVVRVVVAIEDPDERVRGAGMALLRARGIEVAVGVGADEARELNAAYLHHRQMGRPLLTLKLALSLDGRMSARDGSSRWITGAGSRARSHRLRVAADAVMVGAGTVAADDPALTVRHIDAAHRPARVVVDSSGRTEPSARLFAHDGADVLVATGAGADHHAHLRWKEAGAEVVVVPGAGGGVDLAALLDALGRRGWTDVLCEGGGELASSLLRENLVDRLVIHHGPLVLGGGGTALGDVGVTALEDAVRWRLRAAEAVGDDAVLTFVRR